MNSKAGNPFLLILISVFALGQLPKPCESVARTIKVPLARGTTQGAGQLGQPVISYYAPISLGTPEKLFNMQFDVGLNEIFVPHYEWNPFKGNLHYSKGFQCKVSSSCQRNGSNTTTIEYQHCALTGKSYEDVWSLKNAQSGNPQQVSMRQRFLGIADASDARFKDLPVDGFIGLGPLPRSSSGISNFLVSLHSSNLIDNLQFSIWFSPILDAQPGGELTLGGVDTARYRGQIYWHHLGRLNNEWTLNLRDVSLGSLVLPCNGHATLSSALNEVYGPREDVQRIYNLLNTSHQSSGLELIDCRRITTLPIITFNIDGTPYPLLPSNYIRKTTSGTIFKNETCYVAIMPSNEVRRWTLGTNFMGAYYSIFDMTYLQVGFASLQ